MRANRQLSALGLAGGVVIGILLGVSLVLVGGCAGKAQPTGMLAPSDAAAPPSSMQSVGGGAEEMTEVDALGREEGEGELSLAVYERLLVEQELRLRSAGVAMRGDLASAADDVDDNDNDNGALAKSEGHGRAKKSKSTSPTATEDSGGGDLAYSSKPKKGVGGASASTPTGEQSEKDSQRICELAASTCDLERQICRLAARHPDEERYAQVCERAGEDCQLARDACESRRV